MTLLLNRFFSFLLLICIVMPFGKTQAVWEQPPFQFPANGFGIGMDSDANGNAIVVLDNGGDVEAFYYSRITNTWTGPTFLGTNDGIIAMDMDPSGTALAAWLDPNDNALHSAYFNGSTWTGGLPDPFGSSGSLTTNLLGLFVSMNGPTSGVATWMYDNTYDYNSSFFTIGSWGPTITIFENSYTPFSVDFSPNGTAVASYPDPVGTELLVSNFIGGAWQILPGATLDPAMPFLPDNDALARIDANGHAAVVWVNAAGDVKASSFFDATTGWLPAVVISTTPNNDPLSVSFEMAPSGTGVATWVDGTGVGYSSSYNGTSWSTPQIFATGVSSDQTSVSVNASGDALLIFQATSGVILSSRLPLNGVWTPPEFVSDPSDGVPMLIASLSDNGFGFAAFDVEGEGFTYFATVEIVPLPPAPPASIVGSFCKNKFAMQTDCVHIISWTSSSTLSVVAYEIRRNSALIGVVPASDLIFLDHNRCKQTDVYTVTAVDINGLLSTPAVVVIP